MTNIIVFMTPRGFVLGLRPTFSLLKVVFKWVVQMGWIAIVVPPKDFSNKIINLGKPFSWYLQGWQ